MSAETTIFIQPALCVPNAAGITSAPMLGRSIRAGEGFDQKTRLFCANAPALEVAERPTESQTRATLRTIRAVFPTFPLADSERVWDGQIELVATG